MAQGTLTLFNQFKENLGAGVFNLASDTVNLMLSKDSATDPAATDTDPGYLVTTRNPDWTQGTFECTAGGSYSAGGKSIGTNTWVESAGTVTFDAGDASTSWSGLAGSPTDCRWACAYDFTSSGKEGMFFVDLGSVFDMSNGTLTITWGANIFTLA